MKREQALCRYFFAAEHPFAHRLVRECRYPWEIVPGLGSVFETLLHGDNGGLRRIADGVWAEDGVCIEPGATFQGRSILGRGTIVRANSVLRGDVIAGRGCVIGNFTEVKNALLFDAVQLPHFSYVGDAVLGTGAHLGAGAKISNFKSFATPISLHFDDGDCPLHTDKFGAVLGDGVEIGCNAVLNPGSILGPRSVVYPLVSFRGTVAQDTIVKTHGGMVARRDASPRPNQIK